MLPTYLQEVYHLIYPARAFGCRLLANGTELLGYVPHIAPNTWLHTCFAPLPIADVLALEQQVGVALPPALHKFYAYHNGFNIFSCELAIHGLRHNYMRTGDAAWQPFHLRDINCYGRSHIAQTQQLLLSRYRDGSWLYMDLQSEKVYHNSSFSAEPLHEWPDFESMLVSEAQRLTLLFDERGRRY
ncbi:SMI1/KNR4 family protein [Hymenobacter caeli]|uniref:Knr4/Smi1-like domain-containing protein n=1 Tax=Hymenobacter caeli TaxID=2735894 RepID=A0ABX2FVW9_9BACT|nr:SMI1/KNR4 family protein [Hymenobacter caeli]NRT21112.1 hypothetical protein [Hymenobacter caeli]